MEPGNEASLRVATRAGLRREGERRVEPGTGDRAETTSYVVLARLASDPPLTEPTAFRALLNSFLPRKRAISQLLVRDRDGRVLICQLTYKRDWDLPGGVVEVGESPRDAAGREIEEELALTIDAGDLLLTDWLPPWGGWDDAVCLVFDGGEHDAEPPRPRSTLRAARDPARRVRHRSSRSASGAPTSPPAGSPRRWPSRAASARPAYVESGGDLSDEPDAHRPVTRQDVRSSPTVRGHARIGAMTYVYDFTHGDKDQKDLLGGKGANLAEMTNLGLPVPPGFTISTEACRAYLEAGDVPDGLDGEIDEHLRALEEAMGRRLGDPADPLLVSVRSGAKFSMPGMMETVLNVGLNDESVRGLADAERRRAVRARLLPPAAPDVRRHRARHRVRGVLAGPRQAEEGPRHRVRHRPRRRRPARAGRDLQGRHLPSTPAATSRRTLASSSTSRCAPSSTRGTPSAPSLYRRQERIAEGLGTAVNVQAMVFGNRGDDSGSGVAFTRDPASGNQGVYGDYLQNAQGEDVVAGIRNTVSLADMEKIDQRSYDELLGIMSTLEKHYHDMCDIEFTVERGKLWMLQTRVGKRTPAAAFRIGRHMTDEGLIDADEATRRVTGAQLAQLMFPSFDEKAERTLIATGHERLPRCGRRQGRLRLRHRRRVGRARRGRDPGPQGDQPRRPARHGRRQGHPDQPRRQDLATLRSSPAAWAAPASAAPSRST